MSKYYIHSGSHIYTVTERDGTVTNAPAVLDWTIGLGFHYVRSYCERKGWFIEPVANENEVITFEFQHDEYKLFVGGRNIVRITKNDEDISWQDLPDELKGML